jgi:transketolase
MTTTKVSVEQLAINTIRTLSIDAIEHANSGHPGLPMGAAPMGYALWANHMTQNPKNSKWFNRDRFVLSAGHGSMLLYSLLHLSGYDVSMDDIKSFRKLGSNTPGHPEVTYTDGVETTTGPLGQGIATAVGMAMAEAHLGALYNKENYPVVDHHTFALVSDGDLMEGISYEAASLAGQLGLGKLVVLYDSNDISLDGEIDKSFSEDVAERFRAHGWQFLHVEEGRNVDAISAAIEEAKANTKQPTLIEVKTVIGYGSPNKSGTPASHGAPLGKEEAKLAKQNYDWPYEPFHVPEEVYEDFNEKIVKKGIQAEVEWNTLVEKYKEAYPEDWQAFQLTMNNELPENWDENLPVYEPGKDSPATRTASGEVLNAIAKVVPGFIGGSADIAESNKSIIKGADQFTKENYAGQNILFGVREFAMGAALNGMTLHGGMKGYGATFFIFSDYMRSAVRLSALMKQPVTYVWTHDSIAVGEDGATHEPIEHLISFRAMPGLSLIRPADGNETQAAWRLAVESKDKPTALVLSRQNLPTLEGTKEHAYEGVKKGAYVISDSVKQIPDALILATGSEVQLAVKAQNVLKGKNIDVRVVSMPSWDRFEEQDQAYKDSVIPPNVKKRLAVEMASPYGWREYVGDEGKILGINTFGTSGAPDTLFEKYGFTVENVVKLVESL